MRLLRLKFPNFLKRGSCELTLLLEMGPLRAAGEAWKGGLQGRTSPYPLSRSVPPGIYVHGFCLVRASFCFRWEGGRVTDFCSLGSNPVKTDHTEYIYCVFLSFSFELFPRTNFTDGGGGVVVGKMETLSDGDWSIFRQKSCWQDQFNITMSLDESPKIIPDLTTVIFFQTDRTR